MLHKEKKILYFLFLKYERINCRSSSILFFLALKSLKDMSKLNKLNYTLKVLKKTVNGRNDEICFIKKNIYNYL